MNMKKATIIIFLFLFLQNTFAQVVDYKEESVEFLHKEYVHKGLMPPFFFGPVFQSDINRASDDIVSSRYFSETKQNGANFEAAAAVAGHLFSKNESIENIEKGDGNNALDYTKNYLSMPPFLSLGFNFFSEVGLGGGLTIEMYKIFKNEYFEPLNISLSDVDKNFMQEGYFYFDNEYISLLLGRVNTQMGMLYTDALFFNNSIPYTDSIRMYVPFGSFFNLHWQITNIPSVESVFQSDVKTGNAVGKDSPDYFYGFEEDDFPSIILNTYQRFGFQNDFIRAGLSLNTFLVRRNNRFEFVDFIPFSEWHATDVIINNMSMGVDFSILPKPGLLIGFQLGFDEIDGNSLGLGDTETPTIWSLVGTLQNTLYTDTVKSLFSTNIGYAHYLWGNFSGLSIGDAGQAGLAKGLYRYHLQNPMHMPFSSEYGPGTIWLSVESSINFIEAAAVKNLNLEPNFLLLLHERETNIVDTEYVKRTKDAPKEIYFALEIPANYSWSALEASIAPSFHVKGLNTQTVTWFELTLSVKANFLFSVFEKGEDVHINVGY